MRRWYRLHNAVVKSIYVQYIRAYVRAMRTAQHDVFIWIEALWLVQRPHKRHPITQPKNQGVAFSRSLYFAFYFSVQITFAISIVQWRTKDLSLEANIVNVTFFCMADKLVRSERKRKNHKYYKIETKTAISNMK